MIKHKFITSAVTLATMITLLAPLATFADTTTSQESAGIQWTGSLPEQITDNTDNSIIGGGEPTTNGELQQVEHQVSPEKDAAGKLQTVNHDVKDNPGDVQTGVTQNLNQKTSVMVGILGIIIASVAGYLSGLRVKLYKREDY